MGADPPHPDLGDSPQSIAGGGNPPANPLPLDHALRCYGSRRRLSARRSQLRKDEMSDVKDRLRTFIHDEVLFGEGTVTDDQDLLDGVLDSLALLQFVEYVEAEFAFEVGDAEMLLENFRSLKAVEHFISSRSS